tara:strand:+ start:449 stop:1483 length:1035 start_codon:yes stop_codon:yes gene_type:complete
MFSSNDIAEIANIIYSEVLSPKLFQKRKPKNIQIIVKNENHIFYKLRKFVVKEGDIIFTHTGNLDNLFFLLRNINKDFNLTLITHQSDQIINEKMYSKKPLCIKTWFALNVDFDDPNLIPLPLGVANEYSYKKNIVMSSNNNKLKISTYQKDKLTVYLNFNVTTNYLERQWIKDFFDNKKWVEIEDNPIEIEEYRKKVIDSTFVMCPPGNGTETHRMWEALFLGSIPIVKNHITYKNIQDLPVFFVDDFKEVSEDSLNKFLKSLTKKPDLNLDKLSILYWHQEIQNKSIQTNRQLVISESRIITKYFQIRSNITTKAKSNSKKVKFYLRKVKTIKNKVLKNRKN